MGTMPHLEPTEASAEALIARGVDGLITMLNLLRTAALEDSRLLPIGPSASISTGLLPGPLPNLD